MHAVPIGAVIVKRVLICFSSATKCFAELCNFMYSQAQHYIKTSGKRSYKNIPYTLI